jgi:serine/threonine protein kinase/tetratricopeptide (TPR) repeat protein/ketosteroid isomerase-like protein
LGFNARWQIAIFGIVAGEVPPAQNPKRRKRKSSSAADITVRDFGPGAKLFSRYTLVRVLGRGGMGIVWLARDEELDRDVALKFLSEQIIHDQALLADLKRETKRSLELTHPNIVRIHDFVQDARSACISMEYVNGETLSNLRASKPSHVFEVPDLEPLVAQWCEAMHYAHIHARVVHCDLKPANLMLNSKGILKITDFGIARSLSDSASRLTTTRGKSGTLVYMSPQQLNGDPPSLLDDIYSMGATLYELLTSKPPFYRGQIDRQIFDKTPPSIAARRIELGITTPFIVPLEWEDTIAACLSKEPVERPQGTLGLLNRLNLISPLRIETPLVFPKREMGPDSPPTPGTFGLMQDEAAVSSPIKLGGDDFASSKGGLSIGHTGEPPRPNDLGLAVSATKDISSDQGPITLTEGTFRHRFGNSRKYFGRPGVIVALLALGTIASVALWYVLSSALRTSPKLSTRFLADPTPTVNAQASPAAERPTSPTGTPKESTTTISPSPTLNPSVSVTPAETVSPSEVEKPAPVPKDEATRLRNELAAAERAILSTHENKTAQERLAKMSVEGRTNYEKAISALLEGYPNIAESFAWKAERTEGEQPFGLYLRGVIHLSQDKLDTAEALFAQAVMIDPSFREAEHNLAAAAFKKKDYTRARKRFEHLLSSITTSPTDRLTQFLQYRIYLALLLEGAIDRAQEIMQQMSAGGDTPAFYYAHAAWEFRRNDASIAKQWLDSARDQYSAELNLVFADPLSDAGWLNPAHDVESTFSPSATPTATAAPRPLSLADISLSRITDPNVEVHLNLRIGVMAKPNTPNGHTIDIRISFFDLTPANKIVPTTARTAYRWITSKRNWADPTAKYLVATYVRPKETATTKSSRQYGGYIVRLYFDGQFQDEKGAPSTLLKAFPTDTQSILSMPTPSLTPSITQSPGSTASASPATSASATPAASPENTPTPLPISSDDLAAFVAEIKAKENQWAAAIPIHDAEVIRALLGDDYEAITPTGRKLNKSEAVQRIKNDTDKYDMVMVENINVAVESATSAIATGLLQQRGKLRNGTTFERSYLFTDHWTRAGGNWLCVRSQTKRAAKH